MEIEDDIRGYPEPDDRPQSMKDLAEKLKLEEQNKRDEITRLKVELEKAKDELQLAKFDYKAIFDEVKRLRSLLSEFEKMKAELERERELRKQILKGLESLDNLYYKIYPNDLKPLIEKAKN